MDDDDADELRRRALRYRGLARQTSDEKAVHVLKEMARILISEAAQMDLRGPGADSYH